jgi:flagellar biosynthetic protein FliP
VTPRSATCLAVILLVVTPVGAMAADIVLPGVQVEIAESAGQGKDLALAMKLLIGLTALSLAPGLLIVATSFTRIILVMSMLRHALGMQQTPPNVVLISLSLFLAAFSMMPVVERINESAYQPYTAGKINAEQALSQGVGPLRDFMLRQTREEDLALMLELSRKPMPATAEEVPLPTLIPAFMLSELNTAFQIGFIIFVPFLLVDIVVSSLLMSLGMMMMPPMMISLPIKILMFVLIDGWNLVVRALMSSFH